MYSLDTFQGFTDKSPKPNRLAHLVELMRSDHALQVTTHAYRCAREAGDKRQAQLLKSSVLCFAVAVRFAGGKADTDITAYTGLTLVDLDGIDPAQLSTVLATVKADPHTLLAYTTLSGRGVRILTRYASTKLTKKNCPSETGGRAESNEMDWSGGGMTDIKQTAETSYKLAFTTVNEYYRRLTGCDPDLKCSNPTRLSALAHDPDVHYRPDAQPMDIATLAAQYEAERQAAKRPVGRPKKGKSEEGKGESDRPLTPQLIDQVIVSVEAQGIRYEEGSYNKYVSSVCYEMNRYGVPQEQCREWAVSRFADYDTPDVEAIVRSCYRKTDEHATVKPRRAVRGEKGTASADTIDQWLDEQHINTRYNVLTRKYEVHNHPEATFVELTDRILNTIYCGMSRTLNCRVMKSDLSAVIESDRSPEYNPLREYLDSLPQWDGTGDPITELASMVTTSNDAAQLHNRFFKKWLVGLIACWLDPKVTNHVILAYIGRQGIYKSTFMRNLLPPVLTDYFAVRNFTQMMNTDDRLLLTEKALIALEEIDTLTPTQVAQLNAIVTTTTISERSAYARYRESRHHIASFCATGNNPRFLTDVYGTRRWLPFLVTDIRSPYDHVIAHDEVYAQAYTLYRQGFAYWFTSEEINELERHNQQFEEVSHEEELILTYLRKPYGDDAGEFVTSTRIIEIVGQYIRTRLNARKVKRAMERLGFEQRKIRGQRGWNVVFLTGDDIKNNQRTDARESTPDE